MRLLLDENIAQTIKQQLKSAGFAAISVYDIELSEKSDEEIIYFAKKKRFIIITHDKDFGNLIRFPVQVHHGVILLRFQDQRPNQVLPYLLKFLKNHKRLKNKLVILQEYGFRIVE